MEERNASVTLARPPRVTQLPVRYVTALAISHLIQVEPVSADPMQPAVAMSFGDAKTILVRMLYQKITVIPRRVR